MDVAVGTLIGDYRVEALVGSGSMGSVYSAEDTALGRRVALKILAPGLARDPRFRERFLRESRIAAGLEHPNVIPIHGAGETSDGLLYLAMRYVDGRDLAVVLKSLGRLDPARALEIVRQVGSALDAAHARGLVHRDVKPANILLAKQGGGGHEHAYLCDFGLAKHASTVSSLTGDRAIVGTVDYLAPEQIEGLPVDGRVDIYGLGCVFYEAITGDAPFSRDNDLASILAHLSDEAPRPSERRPELPPLLDTVVSRALAKDRDDRFTTAAELVAAIEATLAGEDLEPHSAASRPAAAVRTFLFADVRGYTSYTKTEGDDAGAALAERFATMVRELTPGFAGHLQELRGDEALVVFDSSRQALRFAVELQRQVEADALPRPIGIGVDAGEAVPVDGGFRGGSLNRAARLCSLAKAGEVLATDVVTEMAGKAEGVAYGFRRTERLKGFDRPVGVVEIHAAEVAPTGEFTRRARRAVLGSRPKRRLGVIGALLVLAAGAAAGAVMLTSGGSSAAVAPGAVALIDAASGSRGGSIDAGAEFQQMVSGADEVFGIDFDNGLVARIDAESGRITSRVPVGRLRVRQVASRTAFGSIWAAADGSPTLLRIDPRYPDAPISIDLPAASSDAFPPSAEGVAVTGNAVWVSYGYPKRVAKIDPRTNRVVFWRLLPGGAVFDTVMAAEGDLIWVVTREDGIRLWRLDPATGDTLAQGKINDGLAEDVAVAGGLLWVAVERDGGVWKVDSKAGVLGKVDTGALPLALVASAGAVWVSNANAGTVTRVDPATGETQEIVIGHRPLGLAAAGGTVFASVALSAADARARVVGNRVLRVAEPGDSAGTTDPALTSAEGEGVLTAMAGARLMEYKALPEGGARIVPELAEAFPTISADGRTWMFKIRKGFRFSPPSGQPVTADTVRTSIERALSPGLEGAYCRGAVLPDIVGTQAFLDGKAKRISGLTAQGRTLRIRLQKRSGSLLSRLSRGCLTVVPVGTPVVPGGVGRPIPSAGPYYVDSHIPDQQTVILRNPNYGGSRPQRLDAVVLSHQVEPAAGVALVENGNADLIWADSGEDAGVLASTERIARTYGPSKGKAQRWFSPPASGVFRLELRPDQGPLADVRVRRALTLALDRRELSAVFGGVPSSLLIGPGIPGHGSREPIGPRADTSQARAILGGRAVKIRLAVRSNRPRNLRLGQLIRRQLGRAGIAVDVRAVPDEFGYAQDPASAVDAVLGGWFPDYPDAYSSLNVLLDPTGGLSDILSGFFVTDPGWLGRIRAADATVGRGRSEAYARLDRDLGTRHVPFAVIGDVSGIPSFFSARVGCKQFLPLYNGLPDLSALCLKGTSK